MKNRIVAVLLGAIVLSTSAVTGAVAGNLIGSAGIKDDSVRSIDVKDGTLKKRDIKPALVEAFLADQAGGTNGTNGTDGKDGKDGAAGPAGPAGPAGKDGVSGLQYVSFDYIAGKESTDSEPGMGSEYTGAGAGGIATVVCPAGKTALSGGYQFLGLSDDNGQRAVTNDVGVVDSFPGRMDWNTNTPKPGNHTGWVVRLNKNAAGEPLRLWVVCANAS